MKKILLNERIYNLLFKKDSVNYLKENILILEKKLDVGNGLEMQLKRLARRNNNELAKKLLDFLESNHPDDLKFNGVKASDDSKIVNTIRDGGEVMPMKLGKFLNQIGFNVEDNLGTGKKAIRDKEGNYVYKNGVDTGNEEDRKYKETPKWYEWHEILDAFTEVDLEKSKKKYNFKFEIWEGKKIGEAYKTENYDTENANKYCINGLEDSCMNDKSSDMYDDSYTRPTFMGRGAEGSTKFYEQNPDKIKILVMLNQDNRKLLGRALLWDTKYGYYMDRVYSIGDQFDKIFEKYANQNGFAGTYAKNKSKFKNDETGLFDGGFNLSKLNKFPSLDTFHPTQFKKQGLEGTKIVVLSGKQIKKYYNVDNISEGGKGLTDITDRYKDIVKNNPPDFFIKNPKYGFLIALVGKNTGNLTGHTFILKINGGLYHDAIFVSDNEYKDKLKNVISGAKINLKKASDISDIKDEISKINFNTDGVKPQVDSRLSKFFLPLANEINSNNLDPISFAKGDFKNIIQSNIKKIMINTYKIPKNIDTLTNLRSIFIRIKDTKYFNGVPDSLGNLKNLKSLTLLIKENVQLPKSIFDIKSLSSIVVHDTPKFIIPKDILKLPNLRVLHLSEQAYNMPENKKMMEVLLKRENPKAVIFKT